MEKELNGGKTLFRNNFLVEDTKPNRGKKPILLEQRDETMFVNKALLASPIQIQC